MTATRSLRLFLLLACLASPGCAGVSRAPERPRPAPTADDIENAALARELSLYSD